MKRIFVLLLGLAGAALAFDPLPPIPNTLGLEAAEQIILEGTNRQRAAIGLPAFKPDVRLRAAARLHAMDMATRDFFAHESDKPGFETPSKRVHKAGALDFGAGENIAFNEVSPDETGEKLMDQWMNSPPHRASILDKNYTHIGVGVYRHSDGRIYGVQNFVRRDLEVTADTTRAILELRQVKLEGKVDLGLELALFSGQEYLGMIRTDATGRFSRNLEFKAGQVFQLGWRKTGTNGSFLTQATITSPTAFTGTITVQVQRAAPYTVAAKLEAKREDTFTLELRFPNATKNVMLFEKIANTEERIAAQNGLIRSRCAVNSPRKAMKIGYGNNTFNITHQFVMDCKTGMLEPGADR
ncbi:MAG: SafA/ExsA family spore coat assembly protein [Deinococcota bacterium]|jgi:uncharacterized protein YkwD